MIVIVLDVYDERPLRKIRTGCAIALHTAPRLSDRRVVPAQAAVSVCVVAVVGKVVPVVGVITRKAGCRTIGVGLVYEVECICRTEQG